MAQIKSGDSYLNPLPHGFSYSGVDRLVEWSDFKDEVPPVDENIWFRSDITPVAGSKRTAKVSLCKLEGKGDTIKTLFKPEMSAINCDWETCPKDIYGAAYVEARITRTLTQNTEFAWVELDIIESITLDKLTSSVGETELKGRIEELHGYPSLDLDVIDSRWYVFASSCQSMRYGEAILYFDDRYHLVCLTFAAFDGFDHQFFGNIIVPDEYVSSLIKRATYRQDLSTDR